MHIDGNTILEFNEYHFVIRNLQASGTFREDQVFYPAAPMARDAVRKMVNVLVSDYHHLFTRDNPAEKGAAAHAGGVDFRRGYQLGMLIDDLAYFTIQGDMLTVVSTEGGFVQEPLKAPLVLSLAAHLKRLLARVQPAAEQHGEGEAFYGGRDSPARLTSSHFTCQRCGVCCHRFAVVVKPGDLEPMAAYLNVHEERLKARYLEREPFSWSEHNAMIKRRAPAGKKESRNSMPCVFLKKEEGGLHTCSIYDARPRACRRYLPGTSLCLSAR